MSDVPQDLFDFAIPEPAEPILSGSRQTDPEEVRLVVSQEVGFVRGRTDIRWNVYRRRSGAAVLIFETSSKKDCDALKVALDGFRRRFGVSRECQYENNYRVSDKGVQWQYKLELEFGRFKNPQKLPPVNAQLTQQTLFRQ